MDPIFERAARWGLETEYRDAFGQPRSVERDVLCKLLDSLAADGEPPKRMLPVNGTRATFKAVTQVTFRKLWRASSCENVALRPVRRFSGYPEALLGRKPAKS